MPASASASLKASSIRSSGPASQRSPKRVQPMPMMATLSRMPVAKSNLLSEGSGGPRSGAYRRRLPEIAPEAARCVDVLDAIHHAQRQPHAELVAVGVGELDRKSTRLNSSHEWISYAVFC